MLEAPFHANRGRRGEKLNVETPGKVEASGGDTLLKKM